MQSHCSLRATNWKNLNHLDQENFLYERTTLTSHKKLLLIKTIADVYGAKKICESVCGRLFLPVSNDENQEATDFLAAHDIKYAWLGASDSNQEGKWRQHETMKNLKFANWGSGEPNNANNPQCQQCGEDYAVLKVEDGKWNDYFYGDWDDTVRVICELEHSVIHD